VSGRVVLDWGFCRYNGRLVVRGGSGRLVAKGRSGRLVVRRGRR